MPARSRIGNLPELLDEEVGQFQVVEEKGVDVVQGDLDFVDVLARLVAGGRGPGLAPRPCRCGRCRRACGRRRTPTPSALRPKVKRYSGKARMRKDAFLPLRSAPMMSSLGDQACQALADRLAALLAMPLAIARRALAARFARVVARWPSLVTPGRGCGCGRIAAPRRRRSGSSRGPGSSSRPCGRSAPGRRPS